MASALSLIITSLVLAQRTDWILGFNPQIGLPIEAPAAVRVLGGVAFWTILAAFASALPVRMPRGTVVAVGIAPIVAAMTLGGPAAAGWVALIGTTELRELRGKVPWYGTLANHAGVVLPVLAGSFVAELAKGSNTGPVVSLFSVMLGALVLFLTNISLTASLVAMRTGQRFRVVVIGDAKGFAANLVALVPLGWLMARVYELPESAGWWATLLFALPLYTTRVAHHRFVEMREMFTQTIGALAEAVDKRDPYTSKHSHRVKAISVDIGKQMRVSEAELEALEWGGLLHDVGKIGVRDAVLLKQDRLTRDERMQMNAHPVLGAEIIAPVKKLAPELPIIRHHHEWFNGSGYPDRLIGDEIPRLARILHVADAFEAMTAKRPYRMTPLTNEQALAELRKFAGIQFDPVMVDAFVRTSWVDGVADSGRTVDARPIPLIAQAANRMTTPPADGTAAAVTDRG
jgi:hypothetical protein